MMWFQVTKSITGMWLTYWFNSMIDNYWIFSFILLAFTLNFKILKEVQRRGLNTCIGLHANCHIDNNYVVICNYIILFCSYYLVLFIFTKLSRDKSSLLSNVVISSCLFITSFIYIFIAVCLSSVVSHCWLW